MGVGNERAQVSMCLHGKVEMGLCVGMCTARALSVCVCKCVCARA